MLLVYDDRTKPEGVVLNNESAFLKYEVQDCEYTRKVIKEIEEGEFLDSRSFIDKFGYKVYLENISTGSKTLLNIYHNPDKVFFVGEIGANATRLLEDIPSGKIYTRGYPSLLSMYERGVAKYVEHCS